MKSIKKLFMFVFALVLGTGTIFGLSACGNNNKDDKISVVCTIFPEYDWAKEVVGENSNVELTLLLDNGVDLHSYQPSVADIAKILTCDLCIYVGGESDTWVADALKNATNKNMQVINLFDVLGDNKKEEEQKEGMQGEEEHEPGHEHEEEEVEYDEHVWLSLKNAQIFVTEIANKLSIIDSANKDDYLANATAYNTELNTFDTEYQTAVDAGTTKTLLFGDRFPFRYLVDDYKLDYFAAFVGCSAETEASAQTITFLASKVDELKLKVILQIETSDGTIANTIKESTNSKDQKILTLDSIQNTTTKSGKTYLSIMKSNLGVLREAVE